MRARLVQSLLVYNDALVLNDPSVFCDKKLFWQNHMSLTSEIVRSSDVFIAHNLDNHDGAIPLWAAVEVMSYGTVSKTITYLCASILLVGFMFFITILIMIFSANAFI